ncbi:hypothetical protein SAMN05443575_2910 [Jatrophihabitans endophyticus]|uniref:Uncharacterized protein n=1 Tax=Jatrophihabitans endophyticus TaxID=1206085 RepID=A0A1M5N4F7_9ACTN|nr:hypothetical protein [Jatrophihabitans endophyticus]SHG84322.1 hypothetical protein SAMN05443575_2910 [Jatrophihabitans endophyticus]
MVAKNPYAAVWEHAEHSLRYRIAAVHDTGVAVDQARDHLTWQGPAADRFRAQARAHHDALHQHNDVLRHLLTLIQQAAEVKVPASKPAARS